MAPTVQIQFPVGGEVFYVDLTYVIRWSSSGAQSQRVQYSLDGGTTWNPIVTDLAPSVQSYSWAVPAALLPQGATSAPALVRIVATSPDGPVSSRSGTVTLSAPEVDAVSPPHGPVGGGTAITVSGNGFAPGAVVKLADVDAASVQVQSPTTVTAVTPPGASAGAVTVKVKNPGATAGQLPNGFQYDAPVSPMIFSITPNHGPLGGGTAVTIAGANFDPAARVQVGGLDAANVVVAGPTSLSASTPAGAAAGAVSVRVKNPGAPAAELGNAFTYDGPLMPTLSSVTPPHGPLAGGTRITIAGTNFATGATVKVDDVDATAVQVVSSTQIQANTPPRANPGLVGVKVKNPNVPAVELASAFQYDAPLAATVSSVAPGHGPLAGGTRLTVIGANFAPGAAVKVGDVDASAVQIASPTQIFATTPARATPDLVSVKVKNPGAAAGELPAAFQYDAPVAPTLSSVTPSHGPLAGGTAITLAGANFATAATVKVDGVDASSVMVVSGAQIMALTPPRATPGAVAVAVKNPDAPAAQLANAFTYDAPVAPTISSVAPSHGPLGGGTQIAIGGASFAAGATVQVGGLDAGGVTVVGATQLLAVTPPGAMAGAVAVRVKNPGAPAAELANAFTYDAPVAPTVSSVTPGHGALAGGTAVTIAGANFAPGAGVTVGGIAATAITVASAAQITCRTPAGGKAGAVDVTVKNPGAPAATLPAGFTYDPPSTGPRLDAVTPPHGPATRSTSVTLTGAGFAPGCTVAFAGVAAPSVTFGSAGQITAQTPVVGLSGPVKVKVTNPDGGTAVLDGGYSFDPPPLVNKVVPDSGPARPTTPQQVDVTGAHFLAGAQVLFGGTASPSVSLSAGDGTRLTAQVPPGTKGPVTVKVVNPPPDGQSGKLDGAFTYLGPAQARAARVDAVSPRTVLLNQRIQLTVTGRNLDTAVRTGVFGVRGRSDCKVVLDTIVSKPNPQTQQDTVTFFVTVTRSGGLGFADRVPFNVVASVRDGARRDRVFEATRGGMFTVVTDQLPIAFGFTAAANAGTHNTIVVRGRNLGGATVAVGDASGRSFELSDLHAEEDLLVASVTLPDDARDASLRLIGPTGATVGMPMPLTVAAVTPSPADTDVPLGKLAPAPGQRVLAPAAGATTVYAIGGDGEGDSFPGDPIFGPPDLSYQPVLETVEQFFVELVNETRLVPTFGRLPRARVGQIFKLRAAPVLLHLEVTLVVTIVVAVFRQGNPFTDFDLGDFNEFPGEFPGAAGTAVVSVRAASVAIDLVFLLALVLPSDRFSQVLAFGVQFSLGGNGTSLAIGAELVTAHIRSIRPVGDGRNTRTAAPLASSPDRADDVSYLGYLFGVGAGRGCTDFAFDVDLDRRFSDGRAEDKQRLVGTVHLCFDIAADRALKEVVILPALSELAPPPDGPSSVQLRAYLHDPNDPNPPSGPPLESPAQVTFVAAPESAFTLSPTGLAQAVAAGGGDVMAQVDPSTLPNGLTPASVLAFFDSGGAPGGARPRIVTGRAHVDVGCECRITVVPFDRTRPTARVKGSVNGDPCGLRVQSLDDGVYVGYSARARALTGQYRCDRVSPERVDGFAAGTLKLVDGGKPCTEFAGPFDPFFHVPSPSLPRPSVPFSDGKTRMSLDDVRGRYLTNPLPLLHPYENREQIQVTLSGPGCSQQAPVTVYDGDLFQVAYLYGQYKAKKEFFGAPIVAGKESFRSFTSLLALNGVAQLLRVYVASIFATSYPRPLFDPYAVATVSAVLAEKYFQNFVENKPTMTWVDFLKMPDIALPVQFSVVDGLTSFLGRAADAASLSLTFGRAHLGEGLLQAAILLGRGYDVPEFGQDLAVVAENLFAVQMSVLNQIIDTTGLVASVLAALFQKIGGTPQKVFRGQLRANIQFGLRAAGFSTALAAFSDRFQ